jgi:aminopeptidase
MAYTAEELERYAKLTLEVAVGLRAGQRLMIYAETNALEFVRIVGTMAYEMGARYVYVLWQDDVIHRARLQHAPKVSLTEMYEFEANSVNEIAEARDALLAITSSGPAPLEGIDPELIQIESNAIEGRRERFWQLLGSHAFNWTLVPFATPKWANSLFPNDSHALEKLCKAMNHAVLLDTPDPSAAWKRHCDILHARCRYLNAKRYSSLRYSGPGTNLEIGLADDHNWTGGGSQLENGICFVADIPTFEVFTAPHRDRVNGVVCGTKPMNNPSGLVEDWSLEFKDGRVVGAHAARGLEFLEAMLNADENARFLGEVALVPSGSPVEESGVIFGSTLMDENAASHIALGRTYRNTIKAGNDMEPEAFFSKGGNLSHIHEDVMIGSSEMGVDGVFEDGSSEPLMRQGKFVFQVEGEQ